MKFGDYVRTNYGTIFKIENMLEIDVDGTWFKSKVKENTIIKDLPRFMYNEEDEIINKSSSNIIDLIEVGDYVNGHKVFDDMRVDTDDYGNDFIEIGIEIDNMLNHYIREEDIKSIVTKEQFESMEYRVGE